MQTSSTLRIGPRLALTTSILLILAMCTFWLVTNKTTENILKQQAYSLGNSIARQTAILVTELVLANDLISMNVLLNQLTREAAVAQAAILSIDDQLIAISDSSLAAGGGGSTSSNEVFGSYVAPIALQDSLAGYVRINLDQGYIEQGVSRNFLFLLAALALLIITAVSVSFALAQYYISLPLSSIRLSIQQLRSGIFERAGFSERGDEIGSLSRQYNRLLEELEDPELRQQFLVQDDEKQQSNPAFRRPGIAFVSILRLRICNYDKLLDSQDELEALELFNTFNHYLRHICELYSGTIESDTGADIVVLFTQTSGDDEHSFRAICSALLLLELAKTIGQELEEQGATSASFAAGIACGQLLCGVRSSVGTDHYTVAGTSIETAKQLCEAASAGELLLSNSAFEQADATSRVVATLWNQAPEDSADKIWLVEDAVEKYKSLLDRQVKHLLEQEIPNL
ncbi:MAG: AhpA/YtjB family protein [Pseudohongiellaceae bacterium]|nr:AhpA/YtjB family protein [Pseudohongiellaceae bacterium]